jgi:hypothetical protein
VIDRIAELMEKDTAGDPITGLKWTRKTTVKISHELKSLGITASPNTVARLLKEMKYSLRVNHKQLARVCKTPRQDRNAQFEHITELREKCAARGIPLICVDTKKKELLGNFKNPGTAWSQEPTRVKDHDFPSEADGKAVPYGIYDQAANMASIFVGTSGDTGAFAADALEWWWREEGQRRYPGVRELVILADCGGANGPTNRLWKWALSHRLVRQHGLEITVAHYPPGASKWNPIEHRVFCQIQRNWAGQPLESYETVLKYLRTTTTKTGLKVSAYLLEGLYKTGIKVTDKQMAALPITQPGRLPLWNYTLTPTSD